MLQVCIVRKRDSGQLYAMKYMSKAQCRLRDALKNVLREVEILASLDHPFLVNLWFSFQGKEILANNALLTTVQFTQATFRSIVGDSSKKFPFILLSRFVFISRCNF